jgi:hypothetical protein
MTLRQRQPRVRDEAHLRFIRSLPCCVCGDDTTVEAAHLRVGSIGHGKPITGMQEKPSDAWCLPLCNAHHREQHSMNELAFWKSHEIDPFMLAIKMRAR